MSKARQASAAYFDARAVVEDRDQSYPCTVADAVQMGETR